MTRYARPTGHCHWQRCVTAFDSTLLQVLIQHDLLSETRNEKSTQKGAFLLNLVGRAG